jgi:hypothetical protein
MAHRDCSTRGRLCWTAQLLMLVAVIIGTMPERLAAQRSKWVVVDSARETSPDSNAVGVSRLSIRLKKAPSRVSNVRIAVDGKNSSLAQQTVEMRATYRSPHSPDSVVVEGTLTVDCVRSTARVSNVKILNAPPGIDPMIQADTATVDPALIKKTCAVTSGVP